MTGSAILHEATLDKLLDISIVCFPICKMGNNPYVADRLMYMQTSST